VFHKNIVKDPKDKELIKRVFYKNNGGSTHLLKESIELGVSSMR